MTRALQREHALACRVNIKWRKWVAASDKASAPYPMDAALKRSVQLLNEFSAFMREHEVWDYCDGEHFGIVRDNGDVLRYRFARKGDPVFRELEENPE
jgi:uncharacterized protein YchJ